MDTAQGWPPAVEVAYAAALKNWSDSRAGRGYPEADRPLRRLQLSLLLGYANEDGLVVDIGTGAGVISQTLLLARRRVLAVDLPGGDAELGDRLRSLGAAVEVAEVGPQPITLPDGSADAVFLGDVIEHLPGSPLPLLAEAHRVLRADGHLVLTTPNAVRLHVGSSSCSAGRIGRPSTPCTATRSIQAIIASTRPPSSSRCSRVPASRI